MNRQTEQALSTSVLAIDASRRVGWAKHFGSEAKLDDALRDLNVARADVDMYRRALSWLVGVVEVFAERADVQPRDTFTAALIGQYGVIVDGTDRSAGHAAAALLWRKVGLGETPQEREAERAAAHRERRQKYQRSWDDMRLRAMQSIANSAGCRDVDELVERVAEMQANAYRREAWEREARGIREAVRREKASARGRRNPRRT